MKVLIATEDAWLRFGFWGTPVRDLRQLTVWSRLRWSAHAAAARDGQHGPSAT